MTNSSSVSYEKSFLWESPAFQLYYWKPVRRTRQAAAGKSVELYVKLTLHRSWRFHGPCPDYTPQQLTIPRPLQVWSSASGTCVNRGRQLSLANRMGRFYSSWGLSTGGGQSGISLSKMASGFPLGNLIKLGNMIFYIYTFSFLLIEGRPFAFLPHSCCLDLFRFLRFELIIRITKLKIVDIDYRNVSKECPQKSLLVQWPTLFRMNYFLVEKHTVFVILRYSNIFYFYNGFTIQISVTYDHSRQLELLNLWKPY